MKVKYKSKAVKEEISKSLNNIFKHINPEDHRRFGDLNHKQLTSG